MKRVLVSLFCILLLAGCASIERSSEPRECTAIRVPGNVPPAINSPFWKTVPLHQLEKVPGNIYRYPVKIQFAYDDANLYFRFDAEDDDLLDEAPDELKSGLFLYADSLELFARPPGSQGYWEFHFTPGAKFGAIHFPSRNRRMPSNVRYLPMPGLKFQVELRGTLNQMNDKDSGWTGLATIPFKGLEDRCKKIDLSQGLLIQVTSIAYSVYGDWDEKSQLNTIPNKPTDPHYLPAWVKLSFK